MNENTSETLMINQTGLHGSASVSTKIKAKETKILTIIFSWYFPNKDIADERVGNFYTNIFKDSAEVAKHFEEDLVSSAMDISNWHSSVFTPHSLSSTNGSKNSKENKDEKVPR